MASMDYRLWLDISETVVHRAAAQVAAEVPPRFFDAYHAVYTDQVDTGTVDAEGNPVMRAMTDDELFGRFAAGLIQGVIANIESHERAIAAQQAPPAAIDFTPLTGA